MDLQLQGRTAFISGASAGIGAGITRILAREDVRLIMVARRAPLLEQLANEIAAQGCPRPVTLPGDVANGEEVKRLVTNAMQLVGPIDILVNCAGGSRPITLEAGDTVWDEAFALNFTAARRLAEAVLPSMRQRKWGRIINISGSMEPRGLNAAIAAKAALHLWAKGLSCDVAAEGITVNTIAPGRINSEQILKTLHPTEQARRSFIADHIPAGYFGEPADIGNVAAFLASPLARYITGAVIPVDGGMRRSSH